MKPLEYKDFTIKARVPDAAKVETTLHHLGARFVGIDRQRDTYFRVDDGKLKLRQGTIENLITHYKRKEVKGGGEVTVVYRYDVNPTVRQVNELYLRHSVTGVVEKDRSIYFIDHIKVHIDRLSDGSIWLEIEALDKDNNKDIHQLRLQCLHLKEMLGVNDRELVSTGYMKS